MRMRGHSARRVLVAVLSATVSLGFAAATSSAAQHSKESLKLNKSTGHIREKITLFGTGFKALETVIISFDKVGVEKVEADKSGGFTTTSAVPSNAPAGQNTWEAEGLSTQIAVFTLFYVITSWPQPGYSSAQTNFNPYENMIGTTTASSLSLSWLGNLGGGAQSAVVSADTAFVTGPGKIFAFPSACGEGGASCPPLWTGTLPTGDEPGPPTINQGEALVSGGDGDVEAFNANGCGSPTCAPLWLGLTGATSGPGVGLTYQGYAYFPSGAGIDVFNIITCRTTPTCHPAWVDQVADGAQLAVAILGTTVFAGGSDGKLYSFSSCGGTTICHGLLVGDSGQTHALSAPAISGNRLYVTTAGRPGSTTGSLYAFSVPGASCGLGHPCTPLWTSDTGSDYVSGPTVAYDNVYLGATSSTGGHLLIYPAAGCGAPTCAPRAVHLPHSNAAMSPTAAGGLVYISSTVDYTLSQASFWALNPAGHVVWSQMNGVGFYSAAVVTDGTLYVGDTSGDLLAYQLP